MSEDIEKLRAQAAAAAEALRKAERGPRIEFAKTQVGKCFMDRRRVGDEDNYDYQDHYLMVTERSGESLLGFTFTSEPENGECRVSGIDFVRTDSYLEISRDRFAKAWADFVLAVSKIGALVPPVSDAQGGAHE